MKQTDQQRAKRLLKLRDEGSRFRWNYLLKSKRLWLAVTVVLCLVVLVTLEPSGLAVNRTVYCILGVMIGRILRDVVWLRDIVDAFPFTQQVMDWEKVEAMAEEDG